MSSFMERVTSGVCAGLPVPQDPLGPVFRSTYHVPLSFPGGEKKDAIVQKAHMFVSHRWVLSYVLYQVDIFRLVNYLMCG